MVKTKELSKDTRNKIVALHQAGKTHKTFRPHQGFNNKSIKITIIKYDTLLSEKISGAEGTKLDHDFQEMERKIDITNKVVAELLTKTTEYLQPNPAYRARLGMINTMSKIRGQVKATGYPQTEGLLGESMLRYGRELGVESEFGLSTTFYNV
ncbi:unnamed protein product [Ranitomeya imitator]|uniref:BAR domain-containing protein n=1 Tax=Ranitomeya imitator TaxID=111125 RepID=A0ABN9KVT0_9NEOB|nr:unnamed protein product [Ranitomeya imitator]